MVRLTHEKIAGLEQRLAEWQTPEAMSRLVDNAMNWMGAKDLFRQGGLAFLRDAWIAAKFGRVRQAAQVRVVDATWPDFELEIDGGVEQFEAVEADDPLRRRGDEYRNSTGEIKDDPVEDWIARSEQAHAWIEAVCRKKADKRYGTRVNLVIFLNLSEYGIRQVQVEGSFPSATTAAKDSFDSVWVLWKERAYRVWKREMVHL